MGDAYDWLRGLCENLHALSGGVGGDLTPCQLGARGQVAGPVLRLV